MLEAVASQNCNIPEMSRTHQQQQCFWFVIIHLPQGVVFATYQESKRSKNNQILQDNLTFLTERTTWQLDNHKIM